MEKQTKEYAIVVKSYFIKGRNVKSPYFLRGGELLLWCKDNLTGYYTNEPEKRRKLNKLVGRLSVNTDVSPKIVIAVLPYGFVLNDGNRTYKISEPYIDFKTKVSKQIKLSGKNLKDVTPQVRVTINSQSKLRDAAFALGMHETGIVKNHIQGIISGGTSLIKHKGARPSSRVCSGEYPEKALFLKIKEVSFKHFPSFIGKDFKFIVNWYKEQGYSLNAARNEAKSYLKRRD